MQNTPAPALGTSNHRHPYREDCKPIHLAKNSRKTCFRLNSDVLFPTMTIKGMNSQQRELRVPRSRYYEIRTRTKIGLKTRK